MIFGTKKSNKAIVESWVKTYSREFYQYAYLRLKRHEDAEDVVQLTFIKAFRAFNTFKTGTSEKAWLYAILSNNLKDHLRRISNKPQEANIDEEEDLENLLVDTRDGPETEASRKMEHERLAMGIANLPEQFAAPLLMREVSDMSYKDIAEYLSVPIGTVMSRLSRARKALYEILTSPASPKPVKAEADSNSESVKETQVEDTSSKGIMPNKEGRLSQ
ncbi:MAG TPA: sigma-70 family RNA polymerase sigma factor [Candidatus Obscuribacter sp.]|nr:sigma-70 family RNA polymerase sigma factor [Candidatus Obscuribacter sp.]